MASIELIWFFLWRMTLLGLGLGALGGAAYGITLFSGGAFIGEVLRGEESALFTDPGGLALGLVLLAALALLFGMLAGAPVGLTLGWVDGLLLEAMTFAFFRLGTSRRGHRAAAGAMCASASLLFLIMDWAFHGYPDIDQTVPWRIVGGLGGTPVIDYDSNTGPTELMIGVLIGVAVPWLMAKFAMWWAGRLHSGIRGGSRALQGELPRIRLVLRSVSSARACKS